MARVEDLMGVSRIVQHDSDESLTRFTIPFRWHAHPTIQPLIDQFAKNTLEDVPNTLPIEQVPDAVFSALAQPDALAETLANLYPDTEHEIHSVEAMMVQFGRKAYIVVCLVKTTQGNREFAMHLGRNINNSELLGNEVETDFYNLRNLHDQADLRLSQKAKKKYKFLNPAVLLNPIEFNGQRYSSFTMPFIDQYAELHADIYVRNDLNIRIPYFRNAVDFSQKTRQQNNQILLRMDKLGEIYRHLLNRYHHRPIEYILNQLSQKEQFKIIRKQMSDILVGNALIYILTGGYFPKDFYINAGDWMVNFQNNDLNLYLITLRGGLEYLGSDSAWEQRIISQEESVPGREMEAVAMPIFYGQDDQIRTAVNAAWKLLIS